MTDIAGPILFALFLWWSSTGAVLLLVAQPPQSFRRSMMAITALAAGCSIGVVLVEDLRTIWSAYLGFAFGLGLWAWHEVSFLLGFITGPRRVPSMQNAEGWRRFLHALQTLLYHEVAILVTTVALLIVLSDAQNQTALWSFLLLWIMRLSAKLNIFLGVPNMNEEFLPAHLGFLQSYFRKRAMNALFPVSVVVGTVVCLWLFARGFAADAGSFEAASCLVLATMLALAVIEHWFLVLPVPDAVLWRWALGGENASASTPAAQAQAPLRPPSGHPHRTA